MSASLVHDLLDQPASDDIELVHVLDALSDPVRLSIVRSLAEADNEVGCGTIPLSVSKSTASHHFRVLREAGIVAARDEGTRRYVRLRRDDLDHRFPGLLAAILGAVTR